jgi:hypothetical protein
VFPCLERTNPVLKAATAAPKDRPTAQAHFESLAVLKPMTLPAAVTLVDDIITRGAQMLGAAWRIWEARPDVIVRGFAVIRCISNPAEFKAIRAPCVGKIELRPSGCIRRP